MSNITKPKKDRITLLLTLLTCGWILLLPLSFILLADSPVKWVILFLALFTFGMTFYRNRKSIHSRTTAFGLQTLVTILLVFCILAVANYFVDQHQYKYDLTKNKIHTLSDQSRKAIKSLKADMAAYFFVLRLPIEERYRELFENYRSVSPRFKVEYLDAAKHLTRLKAEQVTQGNTLIIHYNDKKVKIEDPTEEKITNELIRLTKETIQTVCSLVGHGEHNLSSAEAEGYQAAKSSIESDSYKVEELKLTGKVVVPEKCNVLLIAGPTKAFFENELLAIKKYLDEGGRALISVRWDVRNKLDKAFRDLLSEWYVEVDKNLVVDLNSVRLQHNFSVAPLAEFSKDHAITSVFKEIKTNHDLVYFPFMLPIRQREKPPASLQLKTIAKTTGQSWAESNIAELKSGRPHHGPKDQDGPFPAIITVEGKQKDSQATRKTRIVVTGSSFFASNYFIRFGINRDLLLNSIIWLMEEDNLISIRSKGEDPNFVKLSPDQSLVILITIIWILPLLMLGAGVFVWRRRRML